MTEVFRFDELSDTAKENARRQLRDSDGYLDHDWWDSCYTDFVEVSNRLGLKIDWYMSEGIGHRHGVYFNLSGVDAGVGVDGRYAYKAEAIDAIKEHAPRDEELLRIATELTVAQVRSRVEYGYTITVGLQATRDNTTRMIWKLDCEDANSIDAIETAKHILKAIKDLLAWMFKQLQAEFDYLMSDEVIDQQFVDKTFTEDGDEVA